MSDSIENRTVRVSIKLLWGAIVGVIVGCMSIASVFYGLREEIRTGNNNKEKKDLVQDIQIETNRLKAQQLEMDMKDLQKSMNQKEDKTLK